jgi:predicted DNA-binding transcriptional regulator YafY
MVAAGMRHGALKAAGPTLETLRRSIKELTGVRITYLPGSQFTGGGPQERDVEPYALVHRWGWWYLVAFCRLRGGLRTFRVDRIRDARPTGKPYEIPADFDIHAFLGNVFQNEDRVTVTMRFAPESAQTARANSFSWERMEEQADGSVVVRFSVPDLGWAASAVLGYGPSVRVLEPPALILTLREWLQAIAAHYVAGLHDASNKEN